MHFRFLLVLICLTPTLSHTPLRDDGKKTKEHSRVSEIQEDVSVESKNTGLEPDHRKPNRNNNQTSMPPQSKTKSIKSERTSLNTEAINNDTLDKVPKTDNIVKRIKQLLGFGQVFATNARPLSGNFTAIKGVLKTTEQSLSKSASIQQVTEKLTEVEKNGTTKFQDVSTRRKNEENSFTESTTILENSSSISLEVTEFTINSNETKQKKINGSDVLDGLEMGIQERTAQERIEPVTINHNETVTIIPKVEDIIEAANLGMQAMNDLYYIKEPNLYVKGLFLDADNPARYVAAFNDQSEEARKLARFGYASIEAAKAFRRKYPDITRQGSFIPILEETDLHRQCPKRGIPQCTSGSLRYRTADGSCNNPKKLWWGSAMSAMHRFIPAVYQDGIESVRLSINGGPLPSARSISNLIHQDRDIPLASVTHMLMQWGQFIDHDITATGQNRGFNGTAIQCCLRGGSGFQPPEFMHPECLPIGVGQEDTFYSSLGVRCLEFVRSGPAPREGCEFGPREQLTQVSSFIDASTVYSSNLRQSDGLRLFRNGLLKYGRVQARMPILPKADTDLCRQGAVSIQCFKAGDGRFIEQPALTSIHIVFLRLHNRIATQLASLNPRWNDEKLYQETRKIVGAIIQHITYREYLPIVLGPDVMQSFDLEILRRGYYMGYDPDVNPNIANEFSTAAYRFGHSLVQRSFVRFDKTHSPIFNNVSIHDEFSNPANLISAGAVDRIILGLINQPSQRRDEFIVGELTNRLFQTPGFSFGMDLAALNIQRGRDHGIAPYVHWRVPCGLTPITTWEELEQATSTFTTNGFRTLYSSIEDIDLFPAGLAEKPLKGGLVGPTFACIIAQQFSNLRKGDRFWFENPHIENSFTLPQLQEIRRITLGQVLCRTMDNVESVQPFVMLAADNRNNQRRSCHDRILSGFNLEPWKDIDFTEVQNNPTKDNPQINPEVNQDGFIIDPELLQRTSSKTKVNDERFIKRPQDYFTKPPKKNHPSPPVRQRPLKTKINQQNRIAVKRPLGPGENITIFVQNNAVNAPIFVNNAQISDSNILINQMSSSTEETLSTPMTPSQNRPNVNVPINPYPYPSVQIPKPISKPQIDPTKPYIPYNFNDPNNPNPPHYGYSANPANNYVPHNLYFYNVLKPHYPNQYNPNLHYGQSVNYNGSPHGYDPHFISSQFNQQSGIKQNDEVSREQPTENDGQRFGGFYKDSDHVDGIKKDQENIDIKNQESTTSEESIGFKHPTNDRQASMYRFDVLLSEQKSTIEELIQHTQFPVNPIGIIEPGVQERRGNVDSEEIKGEGDEKNLDINQNDSKDEEKGQKAKVAENGAEVYYFDRNILNKYPGNSGNSTIQKTDPLKDQKLGSECSNKTCEDDKYKIFAKNFNKIIKDGSHNDQNDFVEVLNEDLKYSTSAIVNDNLNEESFDFLTETYPTTESISHINMNRFVETGNSVEDFLEMPALDSGQTATASELPKPMKLNLYLF